MLSYLLSNNEIKGEKPVEIFREKFSDDPALFMKVDASTRGLTEAILFNIDVVSPLDKDDSVVLRIFAKMFYRHLGYYGDDLKVARLEKYLDKNGKYEEFKAVFEENHGLPWMECRNIFTFCEDDVVSALIRVLGMSETSARNWFNGTDMDLSIESLSLEIKEYVDSKPDNFRLLFMVDEVGQYIGSNGRMMLNLQSLVESIGTKCPNKVWIMVTSQEAIDEVVKISGNDFSKIQGRFSVRLSLTSSSVDEVIQRRILSKTPVAEELLGAVFDSKDSVLRNLFSFKAGDALSDIKGFSKKEEFIADFPFVPYQFKLLQNVFSEIRKHGLAGKHLSSGERSMLSAFQETAQTLQERDEQTIVPFYYFYDSLHTFLDSSIRRVVDRCNSACENGDALLPQDVQVLKLLYLIRYVDDIKSTLDNIAILMADTIDADKIALRGEVKKSLDRLLSQNYISVTGDTYNFLTDTEQDVARDINNIIISPNEIVSKIGSVIFDDVCDIKKYRYKKIRDFSYEQLVDDTRIGSFTGEMHLRFITLMQDLSESQLISKSKENEAIVVLAKTPYFDKVTAALKVEKYLKQRVITQMPDYIQKVVNGHIENSKKLNKEIIEDLRKAVEEGTFYVSGERLELRSGNAKAKTEQVLEHLTSDTYSKLDLVSKHADNDSDILSILNGKDPWLSENSEAAEDVEKYLDMQKSRNFQTSVSDLQLRYTSKPYGWKEIDVAAVIAKLIHERKVSVKYAGNVVSPEDKSLPDMLRKRSEIGKTLVSIRVAASESKKRAARSVLKNYFETADVPENEDQLIEHAVSEFEKKKAHYEELYSRYDGHNYPDKFLLKEGINILKDILSQKKDNLSLIDKIIECEDVLLGNTDDLRGLEEFFKNQAAIFDKAVQFSSSFEKERDYFENDAVVCEALDEISSIISVQEGVKYNYGKIPKLNDLISSVECAHNRMLAAKRHEVLEVLRECREKIMSCAEGRDDLEELCKPFMKDEGDLLRYKELTSLDALKSRMEAQVEKIIAGIQIPVADAVEINISIVERQKFFPVKQLKSDDDIDLYVDDIKRRLKELLDSDGIIQIR